MDSDASGAAPAADATRRGVVAAVLGAVAGERAGNRQAGARRAGRCGGRRSDCGEPGRPDCRNLNRDPAHCGACGNACPPGSRCASGRCRPAARCAPAPVRGYRSLAVHPHDPAAFTQGLVYADGVLLEGTGLHGRSSLREVELATGRVVRSRPLAERHFGEGIALVDDRVYQLTWRSGVCIVYDRGTFRPVGSFAYRGEGWGIANDGERLVMSDGSADLVFRDPSTFAEIGRVTVRDGGAPVARLNELEWVGGEIWANVWLSDRIARIDPASGCVLAWIDLAGILTADLRGDRRVDVLNGIAHDPASGRVWVTGKLWPALFEIAVDPVLG
jgi:glutaminyl-peptide cyclotransferase